MYRFGWRGSRDFTAFIPLLYSIVLVQAGHKRGLFPLIVESEHADMVGGARASDTRGHVGRVSGHVLAVLRSKGAGCGGCRVPEGGPGSVAVLQPGLVTAPGVLGRGAASTRRSSHRQSRPGTQEFVTRSSATSAVALTGGRSQAAAAWRRAWAAPGAARCRCSASARPRRLEAAAQTRSPASAAPSSTRGPGGRALELQCCV